MKELIKFEFYGSPIYLTIYAYSVSVIIFGLPIIVLFMQKGIIYKFISILILALIIRLIIKKSIIKIFFSDECIAVKKILTIENYSYNEIDLFIENKEGFLPLKLVVAKRKGKKLFHFYCPNRFRNELDIFLENKKFKIHPQK